MFRNGTIEGVLIRKLTKFEDGRGWLTEIFRHDELEECYYPVMGYISVTRQNLARGPHEHADQADHFCFLGPSNFKVYLWDNRKDSPTYLTRQVVHGGEDDPMAIIIPPGVAHAYKNVGQKDGMVVNCPNRLFAGEGKKDPVDEIRHETDPNTVFLMD
ncbi:MAG: dTDP-4-dehydrorhamnose 3,5-epimerase family protein [Ignavibacteria bacterium]|nr:dTDP-4-dehydrorhamnose 3,5-epimerase family protein [Ignavibacteria bacterium]